MAVHLAQFEADKRLAESRQFEAYHRLTAFVMHDLKNLAAQLSLIVSNAEKHKRNPEFVDDAISTIANSTGRMQRLIEQLQRREIQSLTRHVQLGEIARQACAALPGTAADTGSAGIDGRRDLDRSRPGTADDDRRARHPQRAGSLVGRRSVQRRRRL